MIPATEYVYGVGATIAMLLATEAETSAIETLALRCSVIRGSALNSPAIDELVRNGWSLDYSVSDCSAFGSLELISPANSCDSMLDGGVTDDAGRAGDTVASGVTGGIASTARAAADRATAGFVAADAEDASGEVAVESADMIAISASSTMVPL